MRTIKFRAWDKKNKVMLADYSSLGFTVEIMDGDFIVRNGEIATELGGKERFKLMQYTGLKDKYGVEIYEGDILKGDDYCGAVYYSNRGTWDCESFLLGGLNEKSEVIGNIYENPELLKQNEI